MKYKKYEIVHRKFSEAVDTLEKTVCGDRVHCIESGSACCLCHEILFRVNMASIGVNDELNEMYGNDVIERHIVVTEADDFYNQLEKVFSLTKRIQKKIPATDNYLHQMQIRSRLAGDIIRYWR